MDNELKFGEVAESRGTLIKLGNGLQNIISSVELYY